MNNRTFYLIVIMLLVASIFFWGWMFQNPSPDTEVSDVNQPDVTEITMYRSEGCNCCIKWADYLEAEGFDVNDHQIDNLIEVKLEHGIPQDLASCHTAIIDDYIVEGHVPAEDIRRLVRDQPEATGISVPGMPMGSPGMEGFRIDSYNVVLFDEAGNQSVYTQY